MAFLGSLYSVLHGFNLIQLYLRSDVLGGCTFTLTTTQKTINDHTRLYKGGIYKKIPSDHLVQILEIFPKYSPSETY